MNLGRASLIFAAVAFFIYAAVFIFMPTYGVSFVGIELPVSSAKIDVRATYGGCVLGVAIFFVLCALRDDWLRCGLAAQAVILGGFIFGRVIGIIVDGEPNAAIYVLLVGEIAGCALALIALRKQKRKLG